MKIYGMIKRYPFLFIYLIFISGILFILRNGAKLEYEWLLILKDFEKSSEYRIYGVPSAFMPPFYPYFLLLCKKLFSFTSYWESLACVIQATIFFWSVSFFYQIFFRHQDTKKLVCLVAVVFFPPIFFAVCKISSFAFSLSIIVIFFAQISQIFILAKRSNRQYIYLFLSIACGLYLRYEFILIVALTFLILVFLKKIKFHRILILIIGTWLLYLPWSIRNYEKIGIFSYSTSFNYNFAKGNSLNYNIFSYSNFPYAPKSKEILYNEVLYERFSSEKDIEKYLKQLNESFVKENPVYFIKLSIQKVGINLVQYFPDYNFLSNRFLAFSYSLMSLVLQFFFLFSIFRNVKSNRNYEISILSFGLYLFFLFFYSIAPLPRYFLFFFPIFILIIACFWFKDSAEKINTN